MSSSLHPLPPTSQSHTHSTQPLLSDPLGGCLSLEFSVEFPKALKYLRVAGACEARLGTCPASVRSSSL